jgi:hypothetical protein
VHRNRAVRRAGRGPPDRIFGWRGGGSKLAVRASSIAGDAAAFDLDVMRRLLQPAVMMMLLIRGAGVDATESRGLQRVLFCASREVSARFDLRVLRGGLSMRIDALDGAPRRVR